jgi:hypothetical protein
VEKNPEGSQPEVKRIWLGIVQDYKKLPQDKEGHLRQGWE